MEKDAPWAETQERKGRHICRASSVLKSGGRHGDIQNIVRT